MNVQHFDAHEALGVARPAGWYRVPAAEIRSDGREIVALVGPFETENAARGIEDAPVVEAVEPVVVEAPPAA
jgi:hypothetical protein